MKTIILMAHSAGGKDTSVNYLRDTYGLEVAISYTSRPKRSAETEGVEYYFVTEEQIDNLPKIIPMREYNTTQGIWKYVTNPDVEGKIVILDFEGAVALCNKLGRNNCIVVYLTAPRSILEKRLYQRGDDSKEIKRRLDDDERAFEGAVDFADFVILNRYGLDYLHRCLDNIVKKSGLIV